MEENRKKALAAALGQIEKQFGKGSVMRLGDAAASYDVETVSTGSLGLDIALGVGGLPRGRVVEVFGPEASGKTTLTLQVIAEASISTICSCRNRTPASRRWRSPTCWCAPTPSTSWWWIR
jgi:recombination protein RecA